MNSVISLNPGAASPFYLQLQRTLRSLIQQGEWPLGIRIPAVHLLAERFQVHRLTVVKALAGLKRTGWVRMVQGFGRSSDGFGSGPGTPENRHCPRLRLRPRTPFLYQWPRHQLSPIELFTPEPSVIREAIAKDGPPAPG